MHTPKKSVHFSVEEDTIIYTYSKAEYDRSQFYVQHQCMVARQARDQIPLRSEPQRPPRKFISSRQSIQKITAKRPFIRPLDLSSIPNGCRRMPAFMDGLELKQQSRRTRPKLSIDTKSLPQKGPLFLTHLSTEYNNCREESSCSPLSYLSPSSATCI